jgi:predicted phage-related endonuclease
MALTAEQHTLRAGRLGSSDSPRLMAGRWREVWEEKTGRAERPNLDLVPAVQIGIATEPLHARFYSHRTGIGCIPAGDRSFIHPEHEFIVAHIDFLTWREAPVDDDAPPDTVLEAKFHGGYKTEEELAEQYYWQVQHQMLVGGFQHSVLSILRPTGYSVIQVGRSEEHLATLLETLRAFWWHVENDFEPSDPLAVEPPDFDALRVVDMSLHNRFSSLAGVLVESRSSMLAFRSAETELKALVPEDARVAYVPPGEHDGLVLSRSRDGRLSMKFGAVPKKHRERSEPWLPAMSRDGE